MQRADRSDDAVKEKHRTAISLAISASREDATGCTKLPLLRRLLLSPTWKSTLPFPKDPVTDSPQNTFLPSPDLALLDTAVDPETEHCDKPTADRTLLAATAIVVFFQNSSSSTSPPLFSPQILHSRAKRMHPLNPFLTANNINRALSLSLSLSRPSLFWISVDIATSTTTTEY
ncbi:hypothetical protein Mapa_015758 [Marchantia paleacea]|nr:hypothetical protein Mapa_015758 [Marchantia paleacea]